MKLKPFTTMIVVSGLLLGSLGAVPSPSQTSLAAPAAAIRYVEPAGLTSGAPAEYLTLADPGSNFAQYTAGGYSPGTNVRTQYSRVRLLPGTLQIDISDQRYASSTGGSLNHGGTVRDAITGGSGQTTAAP